MRAVLLGVVAIVLAGCSKSSPPEGTSLLERTQAAVDAVCACKDDACRSRELAVYQGLIAESGPTNVNASIVEALAREADRVGKCGGTAPSKPAEKTP